MVLFSIIMPCYNSGKFVLQAIESVREQTCQDWELLVIDDCSTDDSAKVVKEMAELDTRIKYIKTDSPSGSPVIPRNIGVKNAIGRYIAFLDSDDVWLLDKLKNQLKLFNANDNVVICFSNYEKIAENGERKARIVEAPDMVTYRNLLFGNSIGCLTAVYDTEKVGKVYFQNHPHEDYILWLNILKQGYVAKNTNTVEALYRVRTHSVSSNKLRALSWQWSIYRNIEKIGLIRSSYYFINYAYKAIRKAII